MRGRGPGTRRPEAAACEIKPKQAEQQSTLRHALEDSTVLVLSRFRSSLREGCTDTAARPLVVTRQVLFDMPYRLGLVHYSDSVSSGMLPSRGQGRALVDAGREGWAVRAVGDLASEAC